jgi:hypothetical protein
LFRQQWGNLRTVSIEAYWIRADANQVRELLDDLESEKAQSSLGVGVVADSVWKPFLEKATTDNRVPYSAALSMHNGQTAHLQSGARPVYVAMASPQVSEADGANGIPLLMYTIGLNQLQMGSTLQLTASTSRGGNFVVLDVHNRINEPIDEANAPAMPDSSNDLSNIEADQVPAIVQTKTQTGRSTPVEPPTLVQIPNPLSPRELAMAIDRPLYETYQLSTTVRCPKDHFVMIGGMEGIGDGTERTNIYLFVRASVYDVVLDDARPVDRRPNEGPAPMER